jgi:hypothetical protein
MRFFAAAAKQPFTTKDDMVSIRDLEEQGQKNLSLTIEGGIDYEAAV